MKTNIAFGSRRLCGALCALVFGITALWATPRSARARLYVGQPGAGSFGSALVSEYNATTGAAIKVNFITGLGGPVELVLSGNNLLVANATTVGQYNATTGAAINAKLITLAGAYPSPDWCCRATPSSWRTRSAIRWARITPPRAPRSRLISSRG
jgi:hypothetical protein